MGEQPVSWHASRVPTTRTRRKGRFISVLVATSLSIGVPLFGALTITECETPLQLALRVQWLLRQDAEVEMYRAKTRCHVEYEEVAGRFYLTGCRVKKDADEWTARQCRTYCADAALIMKEKNEDPPTNGGRCYVGGWR